MKLGSYVDFIIYKWLQLILPLYFIFLLFLIHKIITPGCQMQMTYRHFSSVCRCLYWMSLTLCLDSAPDKRFMLLHHVLKQPPQSTKHFLRCLRTVHFLVSGSLQVRPAVAEIMLLTSFNARYPFAPLLGSSIGRWSAISSTMT